MVIQIVDINLHTKWQTVQILISWLLLKPTDLDLHCLQMQGIPGSAGPGLTFNILLTNSADDKVIFLLFFPENRL